MADTRLEHIFTVSDRDRDGCLGKVRAGPARRPNLRPTTLHPAAPSAPRPPAPPSRSPHLHSHPHPQAEFTQLVRAVNPEAALNEEQLGLIQEEVWSAYAAHVDREGLTYDGLKELYCDGHADLGRDYEALIKAHRPAPAAAPRPLRLEALRC